MRIVAGRAKGRRLAAPTSGTRPTSDRVREALFSTLEGERGALEGITVLDLYAGTGALGLEALSRGARSALFVERDRNAVRTLRANIDAVGLPGASVLVEDVGRWARNDRHEPTVAADLAFLDPPYDLPAAQVATVVAALTERGRLAPGALVVVERSARDESSPWPEGWREIGRRIYGDTALWYGRFAEPEEGS